MALADTYRLETAKWDAIAAGWRGRLRVFAPEENFQSYAQGRPQLDGVAEFLGDLRGKKVLEYGCGLGHVSTLLVRSGALVTTFDLSRVSAKVASQRVALNNQNHLAVTVAAGESLPFADECFDSIFGKAILHHLDVGLGADDLYRVLKRGGKAVFTEPMGMNPLLNFVRDHVWYPKKTPRGADRPLSYDEIHAWGQRFSQFYYREIELLSMIERGFGFKTQLPRLRRLDNLLLERAPFLRRYCRYVIMFMVK
jgi:SAM-dependent methyltransferase